MKKSETSSSWQKFVKELQVKCKEQDVSSSDLVKWVRTSIEQIEKKTFDYYITSGKTPKFPDLKVDVNILLGDFLHGFTIYRKKKAYNIYPLENFTNYREDIYDDFISSRFEYSSMNALLIQDREANSAKLREFARRVKNRAWKIQ